MHKLRPALAWLGSAEHEDRIVKASLYPALEAARDIGMPVIYVNNSPRQRSAWGIQSSPRFSSAN